MITDKVRNALRSFLRIEPAQSTTVTITERLDFNTNAAKNRIWYRGNGQELSELYRQISSDKTSFWSAVPTYGMEIRKVHTGIPRLMVDVLTSVVLADMNDIKLPDNLTDIWEEISRENNFEELLSAALSQVLYIGDGAFKISIDTDISQYPIIEFYPGDKVEFVYKRGRIREIIFKTVYKHKSGIYTLHEHYGYGYVDYKLYRGESECPLTAIPQTEKLKFYPIDNSLIMAVPFKIFSSHCYEGRGQSLFDGGKCDSFDALDEAWSQWLYAVRMSRPQKFLPPDYTPRNPYNGEPMKPNPFDNVFIEADGAMPENSGVVRPELIQPAIPHDSYLSTYITALDLCLQGIISPSTLGIDVKKLDNAEAQREKEKTTLYTRNKIVGALQNVLPKLIETVFKTYSEMCEKHFENIEIEVPFGEYANPSFESQVETVGKGRTQGIMSVEACVDELYGDTKTDEWKAAEVERIKSEQGVESMNEPIFTEGF